MLFLQSGRAGTLAALGALALLFGGARMALASPIATISGVYDASATYGGNAYDTPTLVFHNSSGYDFTGAQLVLTGYQGLNSGKTQTLSLGTMPASTDYVLVWTPSQGGVSLPAGSTNTGAPNASNTVAGDLFTYDYDDSYGVAPYTVGNFSVTFTATLSGIGPLNGQPIFSVFSPTTNFTGGFVGWEGLDQKGIAESSYDAHNGTVSGTLAVINLGLPPGAPEPTSLVVFGMVGVLGTGFATWCRRKRKVAA